MTSRHCESGSTKITYKNKNTPQMNYFSKKKNLNLPSLLPIWAPKMVGEVYQEENGFFFLDCANLLGVRNGIEESYL